MSNNVHFLFVGHFIDTFHVFSVFIFTNIFAEFFENKVQNIVNKQSISNTVNNGICKRHIFYLGFYDGARHQKDNQVHETQKM